MASLSPDYLPIPTDWRPPEWLPPEKELKPVDQAVTQRVSAEAQDRVFLQVPHQRVHRLQRKANLISAACGLTCIAGAVCAWGISRYIFKCLGKDTDESFFGMCIYGSMLMLAFQKIKALAAKLFPSFQNPVKIESEDIPYMLAEARKNPLFEQIWQEATARGPIDIRLVDPTQFDKKLRSNSDALFSATPQARCVFSKEGKILEINITKLAHQVIEIKKDTPLKAAFSDFIFETCNAYNAERFSCVNILTELGQIDRMSYSILAEYIEKHTGRLAYHTLIYGIKHLHWPKDVYAWEYDQRLPFSSLWLLANYRSDPQIPSHAESYRNVWNTISKVYDLTKLGKQPAAAAAG